MPTIRAIGVRSPQKGVPSVEFGAFVSGLVTGLREGVEAALIVSIILAYLSRTGNGRHAGRIWLGVVSALVLSVVLGALIFVTIGEFQSPYEQMFEGATMLLAAAVVTWMLFWMRRQSASVSGELRAAVDRALTEGGLVGLTALAFLAVIREGLETALFLVGQASAARSESAAGAGSVAAGAVVGLGLAVAIGVGFYQGSRRIDLARFFRWTGVALIFIAAGLVSHAVSEFVEAGVITFGTQTLFDISAVLPDDPESGNVLGMVLRSLFGYNAHPEIITFAAWFAYLAIALPLYLRPTKPRPPKRVETPVERPVERSVERPLEPPVGDAIADAVADA
jgi:high-affinity iron transporter